jgi:putative ABC transport system permease protein
MAPLAVILKDKIPVIEKMVRIDYNMGGGKSAILRVLKENEIKAVQVKDIIYADSTFFDVFSFKVIYGNQAGSLTEPNSIVLTEGISDRIFGRKNSVGENIEFIGADDKPRLNYKVTAIIENMPDNSSIKFNGVVSFNTLKSIKPAGIDVDIDYGNWTYDTYILATSSGYVEEETNKINNIWLENILKISDIQPGSESAKGYILGFVPLKEVPFYKNNKTRFIYLIILVGLIIILLAIINFITISIAKSSLCSKEIGIRKIAGSNRFQLIKLFIIESVILTFISAFLALIIVYFLIPLFNEITGKEICLSLSRYPAGIALFISGTIVIGILAGGYPAFYLSGFSPVTVFKKATTNQNKSGGLIQNLIIFQFLISISLIISTLTISRQIRFMRTADVGYDKENIITCRLTKNITEKYEVFKRQLLQDPDILSVGASSGEWLSEQFHISFVNEINGSEKSYFAMAVDPDFIRTTGLEIIKGRNFSWDLETDNKLTVILNETAVKNFGLADPIDFEVELFNFKAKVIGVVKDFHNESFQEEIKSLLLWNVPNYCNNLSIKVNRFKTEEIISYINKQWEEFSPDVPFEYAFLDEKYDAQYKNEDNFRTVIIYFSIVAILIACLGLFGVVSFSTEKRTKEIGIRRISGATISEILLLLNRNFILIVLIAFIISVPISWYFMHKWLENFAYRTKLSLWIFMVAGILAFIIALLTVSWQSWRAATRNPVEALRYE